MTASRLGQHYHPELVSETASETQPNVFRVNALPPETGNEQSVAA
jgi:hypothetical protein